MSAARGKGRGKGISFNVEALGFGRGEVLPGAVLQPPPLFPQNIYKPVELEQGEEVEYLLALKQEFRGTIRKSPYFVKAEETKTDIERYSDKYQLSRNNSSAWNPDWNRFPDELRYDKKRRVRKSAIKATPKLKGASHSDKDAIYLGDEEIVKIATERKEDEENDENVEEVDEEKEDKEGEVEEDEFYDDSEVEEDTDYISTYFDNGENYGDDDDDGGDEGPTY